MNELKHVSMNSKFSDLKQVSVLHDNCSRGCSHCFCKTSTGLGLSETNQTEAVISSLKRKGYEVHPYVTDPGAPQAFEKFVKPFAYDTVEMKDTFDQSIAESIKNDDITVGFSLHGSNAKTHDRLCGQGNFVKTIEALRLAQKKRIQQVRVYCVIYMDNYQNLDEFCTLLQYYSVAEIIFLRLGFGGKAQQLPANLFLDYNAYKAFFVVFQKAKNKFRGEIKLILDSASWGPYYSAMKVRILHLLSKIIKKQLSTCECGYKKVTIDPRTKKIYPCSLMVSSDIGHMGYFDETQGLVINNSLWLNDLADKIGPPCSNCKLMWFCGGHCRVSVVENNYRSTKKINLYAGHNWCPVILGIRKPLKIRDFMKHDWRSLLAILKKVWL